jgi:hypothetical protein
MILNYISAFVMIFGGGYLALLGFRVINHKKDTPDNQEKMIIWHKKFGGFAKYGGIALVIWGIMNVIFPSLNTYTIDNNKMNVEWTNEEKEQFMDQIYNSSEYFKSINPDTSTLVLKCFVDKYSTKYSAEDRIRQNKMTQEEVIQLVMPIMNECFHQYGLK